PPGQRDAGDVEGEEYRQRQMRPSGHRDRGAEAARDQISAAGTDGGDESERRRTFDPGVLDRLLARRAVRDPRGPQLLFAEDRRDHPKGRAVADPGGDEQDEEHREEAGEALDVD